MGIYDFLHYQDYLRDLCQSSQATRGVQTRLARAAACQPSYFSQVLQRKVHLTEDQVVGIATHLELSTEETEHFLLLLRHAKAGSPALKRFLGESLEKSHGRGRDLRSKVPATETSRREEEVGMYFSSWIPSAVHLLCSSPMYSTVRKISERLGVSEKKVRTTLSFLERLDFVEKEGEHWRYRSGQFHLGKDSPWQSSMQTSRRHLALRSIAENDDNSTHFSSLFTIDEKDAAQLKALIAQMIEKSHKLIAKSGSSELYCFCTDFFKVI